MSKFVGTGPSSYEKIIYWATVSQRLRNTALHDMPFLRQNEFHTNLVLVWHMSNSIHPATFNVYPQPSTIFNQQKHTNFNNSTTKYTWSAFYPLIWSKIL